MKSSIEWTLQSMIQMVFEQQQLAGTGNNNEINADIEVMESPKRSTHLQRPPRQFDAWFISTLV